MQHETRRLAGNYRRFVSVVRAKGEHGPDLSKINPDVRDLFLNWDILGLLRVVLRWLLIFTLDEEKCRKHGQRRHVRGVHSFSQFRVEFSGSHSYEICTSFCDFTILN